MSLCLHAYSDTNLLWRVQFPTPPPYPKKQIVLITRLHFSSAVKVHVSEIDAGSGVDVNALTLSAAALSISADPDDEENRKNGYSSFGRVKI